MHGGDPTAETPVVPTTCLPALVWRLDRPWRAASSAPWGGGVGPRRWVVNAQVPGDWTGADPLGDLQAVVSDLGLEGEGIGFLTAADVTRVVSVVDGGARVQATVGLAHPGWAAAPAPAAHPTERRGAAPALQRPVGTLNVVAFVPARLSDGALVNAVATVAEAKAQALLEVGVAGTGTPTDATAVLCPTRGRVDPYGGPRSEWGSRLARAVHGAVLAGARQ